MSLTVVQHFRFCKKCQSLFFSTTATATEGADPCPAGGLHEAAGYIFRIPVHASPSPTAQDGWRFCKSCWAMFYDGYPEKGTCPARSRGHARETRFGHNFALSHDVPGTPAAQTQWRFCGKCNVMFYDGYEEKGRCAAGDAHFAQGYDFVLPH